MPKHLKRGNLRWQGRYTHIDEKEKSKCFATKEEAIAWETPFREDMKQKKAKERAKERLDSY